MCDWFITGGRYVLYFGVYKRCGFKYNLFYSDEYTETIRIAQTPPQRFFKNLFIRNITFHGFRPTGSCKKLAVPVFRGIESACVGPRERHDSWGPGADPGFRRGGGGSYIRRGGGFVQNFRSGSKLLQGPGQINKQKKLQTAVGGVSDHPKKTLYPRMGPLALTVGMVLGPVLKLSRPFQINCGK